MSDARETITAVRSASSVWGWLPALSVVHAGALLLVAVSYTANRNSLSWSTALFWLSLLTIFIPTAYRLIASNTTRRERIGLVVLLGFSLYLVKVLHSPLDFTFHDEFLHWNTANHILQTGHLFGENSLLPVSSLYPSLEIVATAFAQLSGMSLVDSGIIVLAIARVALMLALYLFYERISNSGPIAGLAALLYTANSNFIYFDAQFSYESLSIPIAMTILFWVAHVSGTPTRNYVRYIFLLLPLIIVLSFTHHLTGLVAAAFLFLWAATAFLKNRVLNHWKRILFVSLLVFLAVAGWSSYVGNPAVEYVSPVFRSGLSELTRLILEENSGRQLFQSATGQSSEVWERVVGIASVIFTLLVLPFGIFQIVYSPFSKRFVGDRIRVVRFTLLQSWQRYRNNAPAFTLAVIVLLHPLLQSFRLTSSGWEIANRSAEFLYWALAFVLAVGIVSFQAIRPLRNIWRPLFIVWAGVIFVGGVISGWPPWARQPGPYMVSADTRSIEPEGIDAAHWVADNLPANSRFSSDRMNSLLLGVYGGQRPITHLADGVYLASVFFSPTFGPSEEQLVRQNDVDYMLVDSRMSTALPQVGVYFEAGEPSSNDHEDPISLASLQKFSSIPNVSQIFDDGNIKIYDVKDLYVTP